MLAVRGIFDGQQVRLLDPVPFTRKVRVLVTFLTDGADWDLEHPAPEEHDFIEALQGSTRELKLRQKLLQYRAEERARE